MDGMTAFRDWPAGVPTVTCATCKSTEHATGPTMIAAMVRRMRECRELGHRVLAWNLSREPADADS